MKFFFARPEISAVPACRWRRPGAEEVFMGRTKMIHAH